MLKFALKKWPILLILTPLICLAVFALALMQNSNNMLPLLVKATPHCEDCANFGGPGGGIPPSGGSCDNVGRANSENPFSGWPVAFWPGDWNIVIRWYCDPLYLLEYHTNHWGIDLARLDWSGDSTHAIEGAAALVATELAIVRQAVYCNPACYNWGMGNFVQIEALKRQPECTVDPYTHTPVCGFIWVASGWKATYMHLHDIQVDVDEHVSRGHVLGHVDSTGNSSGPHLHYQINDAAGHPVDPAPSMDGDYTDELRKIWKGDR